MIAKSMADVVAAIAMREPPGSLEGRLTPTSTTKLSRDPGGSAPMPKAHQMDVHPQLPCVRMQRRSPYSVSVRAQLISLLLAFGTSALLLASSVTPALAQSLPTARGETQSAVGCAALRAEMVALAEEQRVRGEALSSAVADGERAMRYRETEMRRDAAAGVATSAIGGLAAGVAPGAGMLTGLLGSIVKPNKKKNVHPESSVEQRLVEAQAANAAAIPGLLRMAELATELQTRGC